MGLLGLQGPDLLGPGLLLLRELRELLEHKRARRVKGRAVRARRVEACWRRTGCAGVAASQACRLTVALCGPRRQNPRVAAVPCIASIY